MRKPGSRRRALRIQPGVAVDGPIFHRRPRNRTGLGEWYDRHKARATAWLRSSARCSLTFDIEDDVGLTTHLDRFFELNATQTCLAKYAHKTG